MDLAVLDTPHLSPAELVLFRGALAASRAYFEIGVGGSSLLAVRAGIPEIVLVDSDPAWLALVRSHPEVAAHIATGGLAAIHGDIGAVREWGNPVDRSTLERWPNYIAAGWAEWARRRSFPDLIFLDGRFRVACCHAVVAACGAGRFASPTVLMHDVNDERPHYRDVEEFFVVETQVESLRVLRLRRDASPAAALARLLRRQFDYG